MKKLTKKTITAHCIVRNEEKWIWYAIQSVVDWVDQILVFDTGSTDKTASIIRSIKNPKIIFEEKGKVSVKEFSTLRNEQLQRTRTDWFLILDGDEIWPRETILALITAINQASEEKEAVILRYWDCLGDIYHYQTANEKTKYPYAPEDKIGWMTIRALKRSIPGLKCGGPYGREGYQDKNGKAIQERSRNNLIFLDKHYFHTTFLSRSGKDNEVIQRGSKRICELGKAFPKDFGYPEVFYLKRPKNVPSSWERAPFSFWLKAVVLTPYFRLRRYFWQRIFYPDYNPRYKRAKIYELILGLLKK